MNKQNGMMKRLAKLGLLIMLGTTITGCATTVGQEFRDIMADIDAECKREGLGPYLDTTKSQPLSMVTNTRCDILKIKPADPLATEEGRFAYSIKLPAPHDTLKTEYNRMMTAESYFKALCEKAEGDFVFRTVEGVDGIKIMRSQPDIKSTPPLWDEASGPTPGLFVATFNGIYQYVDAVEFVQGSQTSTQLVHYAIDPKLSIRVPPWGLGHYPIEKSDARYGFTFRNSPLENRELGIVGSELIIMDLKTNEVMALRRRFSKLNFVTHQSAQMMQGTPCRLLETKDSDNRFIAKILKPAAQAKGDNK
ncbi:MAG: hypothetical protein Q7U94_05630 [Sideroxyarcus sp.]|nr:hypothetical protein [Sideroxyarcus sp.]